MSYNITGTKNLSGIIIDYLIPAPDFDSAMLKFRSNDNGEFMVVALTKHNPTCDVLDSTIKDFNVLAHIVPPTATSDGVIVVKHLEYRKAAFENEIVCRWNLQGFKNG
jgi:hypothetical protein